MTSLARSSVSDAVAAALRPPARPGTEPLRVHALRRAGEALHPGRERHSNGAPDGFGVQVYGERERAEWLAQLCSTSDDTNTRLRRLAQRLPPAPLSQPLAPPPGSGVLDALTRRFPNHQQALDAVRDQAALCRQAGCGMRLPPMLLLGGPGTGKTMLARTIGRTLDAPVHLVSMAHSSAGFALSGLDPGWSTGRPGLPFQLLVFGHSASVVIVLDEIDKASTDERHSPLGPLYALLESSTAKAFVDEFAGLPIDTRSIIWIATANSLETIPKPLLTRFHVVTVQEPTREQMPALLGSVWEELLEAEPWWGRSFERVLKDGTVAALVETISLREAAAALRRGAARAALEGRREVLPSDLPDAGRSDLTACKRIGFIHEHA